VQLSEALELSFVTLFRSGKRIEAGQKVMVVFAKLSMLSAGTALTVSEKRLHIVLSPVVHCFLLGPTKLKENRWLSN
jgi:hypothetical protein